jgi:3'5'-cyclic nucleotide phosphodiesterase
MMSVTKLLSRIVAPNDSINDNSSDFTPMQLDHTYGIKSDPLTQFACVFSALIHDVDHDGVPNEQLVNENSDLALRYDGKSVAEQNSIDLAWELLMRDEYKELLGSICTTNSELVRFRQIVVNAVMATDLMSHDLEKIRDKRWATAFLDDEPHSSLESTLSQQEMLEQVNRKATAVIEHMIQASDVSHTMQHWHIYRKWNERLYFECYNAYISGRSVIDPTDAWYQGELDFFDFFVIPLATKLKKCGVFGVSGAEYLQYAMNNRSEWQSRGQISVNLMKDHAIEKYGMKSS